MVKSRMEATDNPGTYVPAHAGWFSIAVLIKRCRMNRKGFTLIELMVVILIVAILAAVLAPMLTGRIREAKWTEGKAGAGTIATALRAYYAENEGWASGGGAAFNGGSGNDLSAIGVLPSDLVGKYFKGANYTVTVVPALLEYDILVNSTDTGIGGTDTWTLDEKGDWTKG